MTALSGTTACLFDAYGTLLDMRSAVEREREHLGANTDAIARFWGRTFVEYTWLRSLMGAYAPFTQVVGDALDTTLRTYDLADPAVRQRMLAHLFSLDPFADAAATLKRLRQAGYSTGILSNGEHAVLNAAVHHAGLAAHLDTIVTVESAGVFKPHPWVYALGASVLQRTPQSICFVSANRWDIAGAAHHGYRAVWINRTDQVPDNLPGEPAAEIRSLHEVADLLAA